jgi:hypothetical protein
MIKENEDRIINEYMEIYNILTEQRTVGDGASTAKDIQLTDTEQALAFAKAIVEARNKKRGGK